MLSIGDTTKDRADVVPTAQERIYRHPHPMHGASQTIQPHRSSSERGLWPRMASIPEDGLQMQNLRPHPRPTEPPSTCTLTRSQGDSCPRPTNCGESALDLHGSDSRNPHSPARSTAIWSLHKYFIPGGPFCMSVDSPSTLSSSKLFAFFLSLGGNLLLYKFHSLGSGSDFWVNPKHTHTVFHLIPPGLFTDFMSFSPGSLQVLQAFFIFIYSPTSYIFVGTPRFGP